MQLRNAGDENEDYNRKDISSSDEDSEDSEEPEKLPLDGIKHESKTESNATPLDARDPTPKTPETRHKSPTLAPDGLPRSPSQT